MTTARNKLTKVARQGTAGEYQEVHKGEHNRVSRTRAGEEKPIDGNTRT